MCRSRVAIRSIRAGERSVSISSTQVPVDLFFGRARVLQFLDPVAVLQEFEVLPGRKEHHGDEQATDRRRPPQLALPCLVDLADDRVVAYVLLDGVLEVHRAHASLSIARSLALRARGLRATSSSPGPSGLRVSTRTADSPAASARKVCFTIRSSSE